jgi:hypothetical protein
MRPPARNNPGWVRKGFFTGQKLCDKNMKKRDYFIGRGMTGKKS